MMFFDFMKNLSSSFYFRFGNLFLAIEMMNAPETFQLVNVKEISQPPEPIVERNLVQLDEVLSSIIRKEDIERYKDIDLHAIAVSNVDPKSFKDLIWALIYCRNITDDLEKAR